MPVLIAHTVDTDYRKYCEVINAAAGAERALNFAVPPALLRLFGEAREFFQKIAEDFKVPLMDIAKAFKQRDIFLLLKGVGFSVGALLSALSRFTALLPMGLTALFRDISKSQAFQALRSGARSVDSFIAEHPILRRLAGPALAGFLLWIWLNMSFVGDFSSDFDVTVILDALRGRFSIEELFASPQGLSMLTLLFSGVTTGAGVAWLGSSTYNFLVALAYTGAKLARSSGLAAKLKSSIPRAKLY